MRKKSLAQMRTYADMDRWTDTGTHLGDGETTVNLDVPPSPQGQGHKYCINKIWHGCG